MEINGLFWRFLRCVLSAIFLVLKLGHFLSKMVSFLKKSFVLLLKLLEFVATVGRVTSARLWSIRGFSFAHAILVFVLNLSDALVIIGLGLLKLILEILDHPHVLTVTSPLLVDLLDPLLLLSHGSQLLLVLFVF